MKRDLRTEWRQIRELFYKKITNIFHQKFVDPPETENKSHFNLYSQHSKYSFLINFIWKSYSDFSEIFFLLTVSMRKLKIDSSFIVSDFNLKFFLSGLNIWLIYRMILLRT